MGGKKATNDLIAVTPVQIQAMCPVPTILVQCNALVGWSFWLLYMIIWGRKFSGKRDLAMQWACSERPTEISWYPVLMTTLIYLMFCVCSLFNLYISLRERATKKTRTSGNLGVLRHVKIVTMHFFYCLFLFCFRFIQGIDFAWIFWQMFAVVAWIVLCCLDVLAILNIIYKFYNNK